MSGPVSSHTWTCLPRRRTSVFPDIGISNDAFCQIWSSLPLWIHPPLSLLSKVVKKIMSDETRDVVIVPKWTSAAWWNDLDCVTVTYWDLPPEFFFIKENGQVAPKPSWETRVCVVDGSLASNDYSISEHHHTISILPKD